jgi:hypothetical protein
MDESKRARRSQAVDVLQRLHGIGAINLDVLLTKAAEVQGAASAAQLEPGDICYPYYIHIGPGRELDLVTVVKELNELGFDVKQAGR